MRTLSSPWLAAVVTAAWVVSLSGCGGSQPETDSPLPTGPTPATQTIVTVVVSGGGTSLVGRTRQLTARAQTADGATLPAATAYTWRSSNDVVATVSGSGLVTARADGVAVITASYQGVEGSAEVRGVAVNQGAARVRAVYMIPRDRTFRADYAAAIQNALESLQEWYFDQLGTGRTFSLFAPQPELCTMSANADYYPDGAYAKVLADARRCLPVSGGTTTSWVLYADVWDACNDRGRLGVGSPGLTLLGRGDLDGLIGAPVIDSCGNDQSRPVPRWIGGLGHELGHTFGLPHPPGCDQGSASCDGRALMWSGYSLYPATYLRDDEKAALMASPFFR